MLVGGRVVFLLHIIYAVHIDYAVCVHYVVHVVCVVAEVVPMSVMVIISIVTMHIFRVQVLLFFALHVPSSSVPRSAIRMPKFMVYSIAGRDLLGPVHLEPQHSMEHVSRLAAAALCVPHCKLVSQVGLTLASSMTVQACGLDDGDVITAVADMSPFYLILTWLPVINGFIRPAGAYIARAEELFLCRRCGFVAANHMWHQATDSNGPLHRFRCCYCFTAYHPWKKDRRLCLFNKVLVNVIPMDSNKIIATPA